MGRTKDHKKENRDVESNYDSAGKSNNPNLKDSTGSRSKSGGDSIESNKKTGKNGLSEKPNINE